MVPYKALDVTQIGVAKPEAPVTVVISESEQSIRNSLVLSVLLGLIPLAGLAHREDLAGQLDRCALLCNYPSSHFTSARWPHHLFVKALLGALSDF